MLDRRLKFKECLDTVQQGAEYAQASLDKSELAEFADAIACINSLLRMSSLSGEGLFERWHMLPDGFDGMVKNRRILKGERGTWEKGSWQPTNRMRRSSLGKWFEELALTKQDPFSRLRCAINTGWIYDLSPDTDVVFNEILLNCAERGAEYLKGFQPELFPEFIQWSATFHASKTGCLLSTTNPGHMNPYTYLRKNRPERQLQTPDGDPIEAPRYFYNFGNGEGFNRGNGMNKILNSPEVRVHYHNFKDWVIAPGWTHDRKSPFVQTWAFTDKYRK